MKFLTVTVCLSILSALTGAAPLPVDESDLSTRGNTPSQPAVCPNTSALVYSWMQKNKKGTTIVYWSYPSAAEDAKSYAKKKGYVTYYDYFTDKQLATWSQTCSHLGQTPPNPTVLSDALARFTSKAYLMIKGNVQPQAGSVWTVTEGPILRQRKVPITSVDTHNLQEAAWPPKKRDELMDGTDDSLVYEEGEMVEAI